MAQRIARDVMNLIYWISEMPTPRLGGVIMNDEYPDIGPRAIRCGALQRGPDRQSVPDRYDDDSRVVSVEWDPENRGFRYFSLGGRWEKVRDGDIYTWDMNLSWFVEWLAGQFGQVMQESPPALVDDLLWDLGVTRIGRRRCGLYFARRLQFGSAYDQIVDALQIRSGHPPGVFLTTSKRTMRNVVIPGNHKIITLSDVMEQESSNAKLNLKAIESILNGGATADDGPVTVSNDFGQITVNNRSFHFRGDMQKDFIRALYNAYERNDSMVRMSVVLENIGSKASHVSRLFNRHPDWKDLVGYGQGNCWLKI
jgi:hypothetical protein